MHDAYYTMIFYFSLKKRAEWEGIYQLMKVEDSPLHYGLVFLLSKKAVMPEG